MRRDCCDAMGRAYPFIDDIESDTFGKPSKRMDMTSTTKASSSGTTRTAVVDTADSVQILFTDRRVETPARQGPNYLGQRVANAVAGLNADAQTKLG